MMNIDEYQSIHENTSHFEENFPYNTYPCTIPLDFPSVPLHWHEDAEFIYIKRGQGLITVGAEEYLVKAGDIAFILPGNVHGIFQDKNSSMEYENIIFDIKLLESGADETYLDFIQPLFKGNVELPDVFSKGTVGYESVKKYLDTNDNISRNRTGAFGLAIKGSLFLLFFDLLTLYDKKKDASQTRRIDKLKPVIKYVELHYGQPMTIAQMADMAGFSESHFMRFFKEAFGVSFVSYLNDYRLAMAARLLLASEDTVLTISEQVGFENLSHFNRCFKKKYGKTPREYRN